LKTALERNLELHTLVYSQPVVPKGTPAVVAIGVGLGKVSRDNSSRWGLPVPRRSLTVAEYVGFRRDLKGPVPNSVANKQVYRRVNVR
jgi:hypothetical protein